MNNQRTIKRISTSFPVVGAVLTLKVQCMGNEPGTKGVVFYDYDTGVQVIFPNSEYSGFALEEFNEFFEDEFYIEYAVSGYQFRNVMQVSNDFEKGYFDPVFHP